MFGTVKDPVFKSVIGVVAVRAERVEILRDPMLAEGIVMTGVELCEEDLIESVGR